MNEKIENLIEELKSECQKQGVSIVCTTQNEEENQSLNHIFVIDNEEDLADVMTRILKGEFE
ncbi:hypothetical protein E0L10_13210 [Enterococcus durans]|uniref:hypothetical protein n=1 Tax=Enterococcus durans TaxID=53345 RepID=UPI00143001E8|nr:hypothetical protein [Enterococcus durans]NJE65027.1 hypothetical protein [Enterococcus durans]